MACKGAFLTNCFVSMVTIMMLSLSSFAAGPGLPKTPIAADKVMKPLCQIINIVKGTGAHDGAHDNIQFFDGWLIAMGMGGMAFVDVSDPNNIHTVDTFKIAQSEPYNFSFCPDFSGLGDRYAFLAYQKGLRVFDFANSTKPTVVKEIEVSGVTLTGTEYNDRIEQPGVQVPYAYLPMTDKGVAIINFSDIKNPRTIKIISNATIGIKEIGYAWVCGNLLVLTSHSEAGIATLDISDPENPVVKKTLTPYKAYGSTFNGNKVYINPHGNPGFLAVDVTDPDNPVVGTRYEAFPGKTTGGGYNTVQDQYIHVGCSNLGYAKMDLATGKVVSSITSEQMKSWNLPFADWDYAIAFGNLVAIGDDDTKATNIFFQQAQPDSVAPLVNMVNPADGAVHQAKTSRIGVTLSDLVDQLTVSNQTFIIRKAGSATPLDGKYTICQSIVNFTPAAPLEDNTTYQVVISQGGIKDFAGNGVGQTFTSAFSTGGAVAIIQNVAATPTLRPRIYSMVKAHRKYGRQRPGVFYGFNGRRLSESDLHDGGGYGIVIVKEIAPAK